MEASPGKANDDGIPIVENDHPLELLWHVYGSRFARQLHRGETGTAGLNTAQVSLPTGLTSTGEAAGLELAAARSQDASLLAVSYDYEQATKHRVAPSTTPELAHAVVVDATPTLTATPTPTPSETSTPLPIAAGWELTLAGGVLHSSFPEPSAT